MGIEMYLKESLNNLISNVFISVPLSLCVSPYDCWNTIEVFFQGNFYELM